MRSMLSHLKQTTNVLLRTKPRYPGASFFMTIRPYVTGQGTFDNSTVARVSAYEPSEHVNETHSKTSIKNLQDFKPVLLALNDTNFATTFSNKLHSLNTENFPANVPQMADQKFFFTVGLGTTPCNHHNQTCQGPSGTMFAASVNNVSFAMPTNNSPAISLFSTVSQSILTSISA